SQTGKKHRLAGPASVAPCIAARKLRSRDRVSRLWRQCRQYSLRCVLIVQTSFLQCESPLTCAAIRNQATPCQTLAECNRFQVSTNWENRTSALRAQTIQTREISYVAISQEAISSLR